MPEAFDWFGQIALRNGFVEPEQLDQAVQHQAEVEPMRAIGLVLQDMGFLTLGQAELVLKVQQAVRAAQASKDMDPLEAAHEQGLAILRSKLVPKETVVEALKEIRAKIKGGKSAPELAWFLAKKGLLSQEQLRQLQYPDGGLPQIAGYKVLAEIRAGGVGTVFKARQLALERIVAIKVLAPKLTGVDSHVKRFLEEARAQARLNHQNAVAAIEIGESNGLHYFVMEYVNGESALEILQRQGPFRLERALAVTYEIARSIDHAHSHRIIHRDIKPSNILINHRNIAKLCDLGFAQIDGKDGVLRAAGTTLGTPHYMSPEQARGAMDLDERTDIYSLGASLYQLLTGRLPFAGRSAKEIMRRHITDPLEFAPGEEERFGPDVCAILEKMMAKRREDRYQTAFEVMEALAPYLDHRLTGTDLTDRKPLSRRITMRAGPAALLLYDPAAGDDGERILEHVRGAIELEGFSAELVPLDRVDRAALEGARMVVFGETTKGPCALLKRLLDEHGPALAGKLGSAVILGDPFGDDARLVLSKLFNAMLFQGTWVRDLLRRRLEQLAGDEEGYLFALAELGRELAQQARVGIVGTAAAASRQPTA